MQRKRVAVLASGGGTDLQSIIDAVEAGRVDVELAGVASDVGDAGALERAGRHGVDTAVFPIPDRRRSTRAAQEEALTRWLGKKGADLVVLAGYMRVLGPSFVEAWQGRLINIHPALLPAFPGLDGQGQALRHGVALSGCTTHFVDAQVDHGPIILQAAVPVHPNDDRDALAARILQVEHQILPRTVELYAQDRLRIEGRRVRIKPGDSWREEGRVLPGVLYSEGY